MDEHKTPEEIINDNAAPDAPETDATEACAQPEEVTAGEADPAEVPAPAEKKPMSVRARHAFQRGVAGLLAAIVLLAVSGFGVFRIARGAQEIAGTFDADPGTFVQHDIAFILNTFSDPNGGSAQYGVVPIGGKLVAFRFPARWNASVKTISDATTSVLSGQSYSVDSFIRVTGTVKTMPEAVSSALYDWYTENNAYLQQIGAIGDSDDAADYLPDAIVCVDTVGSIPQGWGWLALIGKGDICNFVGIIILAGLTIVCFAQLALSLARRKQWLLCVIAILEVLVLVLAASGILVGGGH